MIYLDNNATTVILPEVVQRITELLHLGLVNSASQHQGGRRARRLLDDAKDQIANLCGLQHDSVQADQILLTSGGTEANNLAIFGMATKPGSIVVSSIEHPSVLEAALQWQRRGRTVKFLPAKPDGRICTDTFREWVDQHHQNESHRISLVSVMAVNNESGVIQPIEVIAPLCREHGIPFHTDAVQAIGKIPISFRDLPIDALTLTAHKLHGPVGIGALLVRNSVSIDPMLWGGQQQMGLRPGTEPIALAAAMALTLELAINNREERCRRMQAARDHLESHLLAHHPWIEILGRESPRIPNTSLVSFTGRNRQSLQMGFDLAGLACSTGSACASGSSQPSHVLKAMGLNANQWEGALRFSTSFQTTIQEMDDACKIIDRVIDPPSSALNRERTL